MTKRQLKGLKDSVEVEGFDYVFSGNYSSFDDIKDPEFHRLFKNYISTSAALSEYLGLADDIQ